jgi:hypothetical protein
MMQIIIKTESGSILTVDGEKVDNIVSNEGNYSVYSFSYTPMQPLNMLIVESTDKAGNKTTSDVIIEAKKPKIITFFKLGSKVWTVNGIPQPPLKTQPTSTFSDPKHKALNGTTYMPIAEIAPFLDCKVSWDAKEKKVTLTQNDKIIEMWLDKTTARIDGKEVRYNTKGTLYPVSVNGKTLIPLRFAAENLGANVYYNAQNKTITITYPKDAK